MPNRVRSAPTLHIPASYPYIFQRLINNIRIRKIVVGKEVELVEKVSYIDAAQWVHL
ncbi:hypothetical protein GCM10020218_094340 [Dactylosporangium vinaceum]